MQRVGAVVEFGKNEVPGVRTPAKPHIVSLVNQYRTPLTVQARSERTEPRPFRYENSRVSHRGTKAQRKKRFA